MSSSSAPVIGAPQSELSRVPAAPQFHLCSSASLAERAAGLVLAVATAPVLAICAASVTLLSRQSPFIAHLRVGQYGQPFWMWKLRSMWAGDPPGTAALQWLQRVDADPGDEPKSPVDPRIRSRFAAFCRRHSLDELPQLWHVARGDMALIGPRPVTRSELRYYGSSIDELLAVKPGLTGLWQVSGRSEIGFPERAQFDLMLIRSRSTALRLSLLLRTIPAVVFGRGAW